MVQTTQPMKTVKERQSKRKREKNKERKKDCVTDRGHKQVSDLLAVIPFSHAGCQGNLEH